ncbi:hypothetical protein K2P97_09730 [bacterium]|nr:hypothetical protein [bacterium]
MKAQQVILTITVSLIAVTFLTSCGTQKSTTETVTGSNALTIDSQQALASCNRSVSTSMTFNVATVMDSNNQVSADWIKTKFSFLSADITKTGYSLKFYKWRIVGSNAQLDSQPLQFAAYLLANGQTSSDTMTSVYTTQINSQYGFYIRLNDDAQYPYQVLKAVVYKSDGTVAAQSDILIPQFSASPVAYKTNADGTARAENLLKLHPLYNTDVTTMTQAQMKQATDQHCF